ncbi:hypothetical protein SH661x_002499 [Planctomicrobium sp. SH661]|uniref:hypothetical protein n=1 Tax=Planctomicrobium sp. SH661 TaxID=3448124 RepID=UPI003F5B7EFE
MRRYRNLVNIGNALMMLALLLWAGCRAEESGPARFLLKGEVTFAGQPVPKGTLMFVPDNAKGNFGPGVMVLITDGRFQMEDNQGVIGGPHLVTVSGYDGVVQPEMIASNGAPLFRSFEIQQDLPMKDDIVNFDVPSTQATKKK